MTDFNYADLLRDAKEKLPKGVTEEERFKIPEVDIFIEGKTTVVKNFMDIVESIRREPADLMAFLQRELGAPGNIDARRAIFKSRLGVKQLEARIQAYVNTYVMCSECKRPDTHLSKDGRIDILECEACGARRPIGARKTAASQQARATLSIGNVYEVMIQDIGSKGDGIAKVDKYVIYVPGTAKGSVVKVKIENIHGNTAFARLVQE